ncbi:hypothetical protein F441_03380 [Phytophthora nicotianae CJ01A1]|uniref:Uncharacterized protein n=3 Tax=Phytophthora nicotianae TaxID=4792 RepID=V9FTH6_PHYNI|nr:hypothetical protein F443_03392 [Phytophthora nicotianae P1569]ETP23514.1 hypothetical protein F441_03380 [Phytophthora nicotianae CJ01A1]ETP51522.1 hypothetical protein F442_03362 [Phytophthora nicotianae P10297]
MAQVEEKNLFLTRKECRGLEMLQPRRRWKVTEAPE